MLCWEERLKRLLPLGNEHMLRSPLATEQAKAAPSGLWRRRNASQCQALDAFHSEPTPT